MECDEDSGHVSSTNGHVTSSSGHVTTPVPTGQGGMFDVVEDPVNSVVHTQAVEQVPRTGLTGSDKLDEQVMDTEEPVETETQAPSSMEGSEVRSFTPPPDSMSSDTYSHSTEQTASQPPQGTENGAGDVPVPSEREREGKGEGEKEGGKSSGEMLARSQPEVRVQICMFMYIYIHVHVCTMYCTCTYMHVYANMFTQ